jgi:hypothetical protein
MSRSRLGRVPGSATPLDLTVHIGTGKTGSKSVQNFLRENRQTLAELGLLYPETPGDGRHRMLGHFTRSRAELETNPSWNRKRRSDPAWFKNSRSDPARFRREFRRRLFAEIESSGLSRVLLSDEILFGALDPAMRRLRRLTDQMAESLRLIVYLRRQDEHMVSRYQQGTKHDQIPGAPRLRDWAQRDMSSLYDYHARLCTWRRRLEPDEFVVRRFEPDAFVGGSLYQDFLDAARIDARAEHLQQAPRRNESLDAESVEFLRLLNLRRQEEGGDADIPHNRTFIDRLAEASAGPVLTLPAEVLDAFMIQWEESNHLVALDFLGDQDGQLFHGPRRSQGTTAHQQLDPDRLDHFLEVVELPERVHDPLRRLAEREARSR